MISKPRKCLHCGNEWNPRIFNKKRKKPKKQVCPKCHNPWNEKRVYKGISVRR